MKARSLILGLTILAVVAAASRTHAQPYWGGYGRDPQHSAVGDVATQSLSRIRWQIAVDRRPVYSGTQLLVHYGSPLITQANTVIVPVKVGYGGNFNVDARSGLDGKRIWRKRTDYRLPPHNWTPSFSPGLSSVGKVWIPAAGGTVLVRSSADDRRASVERIAYYGLETYKHGRTSYRENVFINTPITPDTAGNVYFGVLVTGATPANLQSAIVRINDAGVATSVSPAQASGDPAMTEVTYNSAPALSHDGTRLYVAVSNGERGYLLALDSTTLSTIAIAALHDPASGQDSLLLEDSTASPSIGPDGDVYFGVFDRPGISHSAHGWLLHFDANLNLKSPPGGFGWDNTASMVPASMVPSYTGTSTYLLMTKYNNYAGVGWGDGVNRIAILDPNDSMTDPISGGPIMKEVMTVAGPTPDYPSVVQFYPNAVREWCINTAAVDPLTNSILANNEDGKLYRWDLTTGALSETIVLTAGLGEAYTPTLTGPDGTVYAINNGILFAVGN